MTMTTTTTTNSYSSSNTSRVSSCYGGRDSFPEFEVYKFKKKAF
jgi:hypothetical protein